LAPDAEAQALPAAMSEDALADHFAAVHCDKWRFVKLWGSWLEWRGDGWHKDETGKSDRMCIEITRQALYWTEAAQLTPDGKRRISSKRTAGAIRDMAANDRRIAATVDQWDRDSWLLGVPGGVVDLETGQLIGAEPDQYITKRCSVAPEPGPCPHWIGLLERVTQGDAALLAYLQRLCGYILTGETREECFAFVYGPAQTGKSTFIRVVSEILGEYHCKASMETFTESRHERHAEELAVLAGARLVTAVETEEGRRWNESRIKALTGRDRIRARFMRENSFEFEPQFKLVIAGNHAPHLRNVDDAMRRRLHIIPFTQPIPMAERDDQLAEKLRAEYPQILHWMVQGAIEWQAQKLGRPDQIAQAVDDYMESEDTFGEWLNECTTRDAKARCLSGGAYKNYKQWADAAGEYSMSQKRFVQALKERGFDTIRSNGKRWIDGLSLKLDDSAPPDIPYDC
jgi:putative DNA primase/helicase